MMRVGLVFGSRSVEHEISVTTAGKAYEVLRQLTGEYETVPMYVNKDGAWLTGGAVARLLTVEAEGRATEDLSKRKSLQQAFKQELGRLERGTGSGEVEQLFLAPDRSIRNLCEHPERRAWFRGRLQARLDIAFPVVHGTHGEDGTLQGLFELADIPYVGPGVAASSAGMDKILSKLIFRGAGLPTVEATWFTRRQWLENEATVAARVESSLAYPVVVKPAMAGSSVGIVRAASTPELRRAVAQAVQFSSRVLVERAVEDRVEVQCAVLGNHDLTVSECEELVRAAGIVSYEDKYLRRVETAEEIDIAPSRIPARIPEDLARQMKSLALDAFRALDARGISRVDFLVDRSTMRPYVNEVNTLPGSLCLRLWEASGVKPVELIRRLLTLAVEAHAEKGGTRFESQEGTTLVDKKHLMSPRK
ncbi:MAG TPA: D-alanine--D-alanine ligase family protein [Candidatus Methylomirabilis sp.]|nr:D-alanine--D-alanine ligase family protein [Candidatus Methylomirabilis sp.]